MDWRGSRSGGRGLGCLRLAKLPVATVCHSMSESGSSEDEAVVSWEEVVDGGLSAVVVGGVGSTSIGTAEGGSRSDGRVSSGASGVAGGCIAVMPPG